MTKKDYELIARTLLNQRYQQSNVDINTLRITCEMLAGQFEASNPRFDRSRFLKACGLSED